MTFRISSLTRSSGMRVARTERREVLKAISSKCVVTFSPMLRNILTACSTYNTIRMQERKIRWAEQTWSWQISWYTRQYPICLNCSNVSSCGSSGETLLISLLLRKYEIARDILPPPYNNASRAICIKELKDKKNNEIQKWNARSGFRSHDLQLRRLALFQLSYPGLFLEAKW